MGIPWGCALWRNFLGQSPGWYKLALIISLIVNPLIFLISPFVAGRLLIAKFTFALAMALRYYSLLPDDLLAIETVFIGMTSAEHVREEVTADLEVLLLLMLMVADIYFMKRLLLFILTRLLLGIRSKMLLSLSFCVTVTSFSAFLDALIVVAAAISAAVGFYGVYHRVASSRTEDTDLQNDNHIDKHYKVVLGRFRGFLRSLMIHVSVGTVLGGVMTMVGKPQNPIIVKAAGWHFDDFFLRMSPVTVSVLICGLLTCLLVEKLRWFNYGEILPERVREILRQFSDQSRFQRIRQDKTRLVMQAITGAWLVTALTLHLAGTGLIGLSAIILATSLTGVTDEHVIGGTFTESLSFTALLTVLFSVAAAVVNQQLSSPIIRLALQASEHAQLSLFYIFNGPLSSISDDVFVGTIYINEAKAIMKSGAITLKQYELLAIAINASTNLPSVTTPNGQAVFLFPLTSALAPLIRLSYSRMMWMILPYTPVLALAGLLYVGSTFAPVTEQFMQIGWIATL